MKKEHDRSENDASLRRHAEERLRAASNGDMTKAGDADVRKLLHELQVHQIELEMQNTELQRIADELEAGLQRYSDLYDFAPVGYLTVDRKGNVLAANLTVASLLGFERSRLSGQSLLPMIDVKNRNSFMAFLDGAFESKGSEACEISLLKEGKIPLIVHIEAAPDHAGRECRLGLIDVTNERHLQAQVLASQKLAAIGRLASGVAHEFRNQLTVITGYSEMILRQPFDEKNTRSMVEFILKAAERSASVTGQLLAFSRKDMLRPSVVNMAALVAETTQRLQILVGNSVYILVDGKMSDCPVNISASQFEQAMMNLAANARDAMPKGGILHFAISNIELSSRAAATIPDANSGQYVQVSVSDEGCGMSQETLSRLFEPFFTTKNIGMGTGLGLASVYGFIRQSGGFITVQSEPGKGATFNCHFPRARGIEAPVEKTLSIQPTPSGSETILIAEDERPIRQMLMKALGDAGYRVLEAGNANEAMKVMNNCHDRIDLLIADVMMPGPSGLELAWHIREKWPEMSAFFISGYDSAELMRRGIDVSRIELIHKPFGHVELLAAVRRILDSAHKPVE